MQSVNPFSGEVIKNYAEYTSAEVNTIIDQVDTAFHQWKLTDFEYRTNLMRNLQSGLLAKKAPFYPPTVLANVVPGMPAYHEELFGPVAALFRFKTEDEAIKIANNTKFGLGAAVFTTDLNKGKQLAEKGLDAGCVFINDFVKSDPRLPFGGIKESGYGRELSKVGIREFVNIKTIVVT